MGGFVKGDVIVAPFPYSDLSQSKRRPALVVRQLPGDDVILCQITSKALQDGFAIPFEDGDFEEGKLAHNSNIRPNRLFAADSSIILYRAGTLKQTKIEEVIPADIIGYPTGLAAVPRRAHTSFFTVRDRYRDNSRISVTSAI